MHWETKKMHAIFSLCNYSLYCGGLELNQQYIYIYTHIHIYIILHFILQCIFATLSILAHRDLSHFFL